MDRVRLKINGLSLRFGGVEALTDVDIQVEEGEILSIIGPNGAGKTCVLNCINGFYRGQKGEIYFEGKNITQLPAHKIAKLGLARTFQNIELYTGLSTIDNLLAARHIFFRDTIVEGAIYFGRTHKEEVKHRKIVEGVIDFLEMEAIRDTEVGLLSYGMRKRVELGRALAMEPKVLLLDEPMAGMNLEERQDMVRYIIDIFEEKQIPIILVEHDMEVVMDIADRVVVLDFGRKIADGTPQEIRTKECVIKAYLGE